MRKRHPLWAGFACVMLGLAAGCASPGVPKPPSLQLPERATNVKAQRTGNRVELTWLRTDDTTDGVKIKGDVTAAICRSVRPSGPCTQVLLVPTSQGENHAVESLPLPETGGPPRLLEYHIELKNTRGRSADRSAAAYTAAGDAPETPVDFAVRPRREGEEVTWRAAARPGSVVEVTRTVLPATSGPTSKKVPPEQVLVAGPPGPGPDPGGLLDRSVKEGVSYQYVAQRVRIETLGGHPVELRSEPSPVVSVTYRNVFAPAAPTGLVTIPGGGYGKPLVIDLSWDAGGEPGLSRNVTAYRVYRSTDGAPPVLMTSRPIDGPAYRDEQVAAGHRYQYRVTALDAYGNESERSAEAGETLR